MTLEEHLKKLAAGDRSDFDEFYRATKGMIYHIALGILRDRALAEDVMQSCYLKAVSCAASFRGGNAGAWLAKIARNEALNVKKRAQREHAVDVSENEFLFGSARVEDYGALTDLARRLLPEAEFTVLMLAAADGYKRREIAQMLGIPIATVTWRYHRAITQMRRALEEGER